MIRRPPRSTQSRSSAASDVYKRQVEAVSNIRSICPRGATEGRVARSAAGYGEDMRETLRLGRVNGIAVGVNWSVLVIFALITLGLAAGRFPDLYPDLPAVAYGAAGLAAGVLFFASLLAHELSHAIVAQRNGVGVD